MTKPNPITKDTPDFEEVVELGLEALAEDLINYDQRMTEAKAPNIRFTHKYTAKTRKAILAAHNQAIEAALREARIDELENAQGHEMGLLRSPYITERLAQLQTPTNQKGGENHA